MSSNVNIQTLKDWMTFFVAVIVAVSGVIFWAKIITS